jgi:hypothetical protein
MPVNPERSGCRFIVTTTDGGKPLLQLELFHNTVSNLKSLIVGFEVLARTTPDQATLVQIRFCRHFLNWVIESHYCFMLGRPVWETRWDGSGNKENGAARLGCDYGRTMRVWVLLASVLNSVRRKSKNPRESGRPELRSRASRKTKTSAFRASLSRRWGSPMSRPSSS